MSTLGLLWAALSWALGASASAWAVGLTPDSTQFTIAGGPADGHCG